MSAGIEQSSHHVKFNLQEDEIKNHHENLEIMRLGSNKYDINLGYLKVDHYYKVTFNLKLEHNNKKFEFLKDKSSKHVTLKDVKLLTNTLEPNLYEISVVFYAFKEKHDKETIYFGLDDNQDNLLEVHLEAKVLGAHQGTPLLRNGITLLPNHTNHHLSSSNERLHFNIN